MADTGKVRIRVPSSIKPGEIVRVRALVIHPMERIERDAQGKIIAKKYSYIDRVEAHYQGKTVVAFDTTQSVSENPFFAFTFKATGPKLAPLFDGSEQLVSVVAVPYYSRQVYLPGS